MRWPFTGRRATTAGAGTGVHPARAWARLAPLVPTAGALTPTIGFQPPVPALSAADPPMRALPPLGRSPAGTVGGLARPAVPDEPIETVAAVERRAPDGWRRSRHPVVAHPAGRHDLTDAGDRWVGAPRPPDTVRGVRVDDQAGPDEDDPVWDEDDPVSAAANHDTSLWVQGEPPLIPVPVDQDVTGPLPPPDPTPGPVAGIWPEPAPDQDFDQTDDESSGEPAWLDLLRTLDQQDEARRAHRNDQMPGPRASLGQSRRLGLHSTARPQQRTPSVPVADAPATAGTDAPSAPARGPKPPAADAGTVAVPHHDTTHRAEAVPQRATLASGADGPPNTAVPPDPAPVPDAETAPKGETAPDVGPPTADATPDVEPIPDAGADAGVGPDVEGVPAADAPPGTGAVPEAEAVPNSELRRDLGAQVRSAAGARFADTDPTVPNSDDPLPRRSPEGRGRPSAPRQHPAATIAAPFPETVPGPPGAERTGPEPVEPAAGPRQTVPGMPGRPASTRRPAEPVDPMPLGGRERRRTARVGAPTTSATSERQARPDRHAPSPRTDLSHTGTAPAVGFGPASSNPAGAGSIALPRLRRQYDGIKHSPGASSGAPAGPPEIFERDASPSMPLRATAPAIRVDGPDRVPGVHVSQLQTQGSGARRALPSIPAGRWPRFPSEPELSARPNDRHPNGGVR
ncbi:hypothetical protein Athai_47060 [Actinocatenispora thailandica]|uniref:Uncharacterized protein n=1 Tax=Actinocatenispora thailandica TaxID=227318 RepID=A0A7R7HYL0_9ACTN|nr:hypothetical protein Athai_47060 [Actinocatenispora thailandica]